MHTTASVEFPSQLAVSIDRTGKPHRRVTSRPLSQPTDDNPQADCITTIMAAEQAAFAPHWHSFLTRLRSGIIMLLCFVVLTWFGSAGVILLVFACQVLVFNELQSLSSLWSHSGQLPFTRALDWFWFACSLFISYSFVFDHCLHIAIPYRTLLSFGLYCAGLVRFVVSLSKGHYKGQFASFAWIHLSLLWVVGQSTVLLLNLFHGSIWFVLPALLIASKDTWAYVCGSVLGMTPLISLSPRKTWEGFVGGLLLTMVTGAVLSAFIMQFPSLVCPQTQLSILAASHWCALPSEFVSESYALPRWLRWLPVVGGPIIQVAPFQFHALWMALFASVVTPFGGFFASGVKRALCVKDFGDSIPGHGGFSDRMDCQLLMGGFVWVLCETFVSTQ
jgi:phosphatidate cytidylyltransferase